MDNDLPIEKPAVLDHVLEAHWKELHLSPGMDFGMLQGMQENVQLEFSVSFLNKIGDFYGLILVFNPFLSVTLYFSCSVLSHYIT